MNGELSLLAVDFSVFSLKQTSPKGEEHGYFSMGGSTVVLLFKKGSIEFDDDLVQNSAKV